MARQTQLTSLKRISEINLTPLMDLTFILLITFIITFPLIEQGVPVNLPTGEASTLDPDTARTISLDGEGGLYLDNFPVTFVELDEKLGVIVEENPDVMILVRADEEIMYGDVVEILKILRKAKITKMALVTQSEGKSAS